jgi:metallo-beta-lactamase family protein
VKLHFLGANRQVTGSRYCLEVGESKILVDCGMFQEREYQSRNWEPSPIPPNDIDALLLTHVHIDHSGLIPKLVREGFGGPIYATRPSVALAEIMLRDSARIQMEDAEYKKKRHHKEGRQGKYPEVPLYANADVDETLPLFRPVAYSKSIDVAENVTAMFFDAGHILGSAMIEISAKQNGHWHRVLFSGDIGQWDKPIIRDPTLFTEADYVVMESTYGDRDHRDAGDIETQIRDVISRTLKRGGKVVIPTFAVERAQELMYFISRLVHADRIPDVPVFLDSPMAVDVTDIFRQFRDCFDQETWNLIASDEPPLRFPGLHLADSVEQSKAINEIKEPCIIMATSGMCTAGRIKHHLRRYIGDPKSTILFVGYQAHGTLGRQILDGKPLVRIHGREYRVQAEVAQVHGFSGHADRSDLLRWIGNLKQPPKRIFLTHGEEDAANSLARHIKQQLGWPVTVPAYRSSAELE